MSLRSRYRLHTYPGPEPGSTALGAGSPSAEKDGHCARAQRQTFQQRGKELGRGEEHPPPPTRLFCHPQPRPCWAAASRACTQRLGGMAGAGDSPQKPPPSQAFPITLALSSVRTGTAGSPGPLGFPAGWCIQGQHPSPIRAGFCHGSSSSSPQATHFC